MPMTPAWLLAARLRADVCAGPLDAALQRAGAILAGCSSERQEAFELRLRRWWDDLAGGLGELYGEQATAVADRLVELAATAYRDRDPDLHRLDARRLLEPDWLQSPRMFGYAAYADRFATNLRGVGERIGYLRELGVTYLHLMPLLCSREGDNDGGYAVSDFRTVRPDLGTVEDLRALATTLRDNGISLVLDLVLNHVAREHEWARRARAGEPAYRDYFYVYPDRTEPDRYEASLPEVFPDFAPGSFTYDEQLRGWVWTTFNAWQWDVNWSNPDVLVEYADVILFLANLGVEVDPPGRHRLHLETPRHQLPEPTGSARPHPGAAHRSADRLSRSVVQGRGHRRPARPRAVPRPGAPLRQGQRPGLPQLAHGPVLVDAGHPGRAPHRARATRPSCHPADRVVDHLPALP